MSGAPANLVACGARMRPLLARRSRVAVKAAALLLVLFLSFGTFAAAQSGSRELPELTEPVNDFAGVIDGSSRRELDAMIRGLKAASGDVVVVATVQTIKPYADIREYAVKLFENHGKGIGDRAKDNGLLILVAIDERQIWMEVGYGLEQWITDGFAGETSREVMRPEFREGRYGGGLVAGTSRVIGRIAQGRGVTVQGVEAPREERRPRGQLSGGWILLIFIIIFLLGRIGGGPRRGMRRRGWSSGIGPFGAGWMLGQMGRRGGFGGGGFGGGGWGRGGGFGGGFGGFGGGRSGGGGGGSGW